MRVNIFFAVHDVMPKLSPSSMAFPCLGWMCQTPYLQLSQAQSRGDTVHMEEHRNIPQVIVDPGIEAGRNMYIRRSWMNMLTAVRGIGTRRLGRSRRKSDIHRDGTCVDLHDDPWSKIRPEWIYRWSRWPDHSPSYLIGGSLYLE